MVRAKCSSAPATVAILFVCLTLLAAGCGDDAAATTQPPQAGEPAGSTEPSTSLTPSETTSTIVASDEAGKPAAPQATEDEQPQTEVPGGEALDPPDRSQDAATPALIRPVAEGDSGDAVLTVQRRLDSLGFAPGTLDGSYGRRTTAAVAAFQGLVGLPESGAADGRTITALSAYRYDGLVLHVGDEGKKVEELQQRLADGPFDPGEIDGVYGTTTVQAVWALEKLAGVPVDGDWGPLDEQAWEDLQAGRVGTPTEDHDFRWVEVDLSEQLVKVFDPGESTPTLVSHSSSGSGVPWSNEEHSGSSITPLGDFEIQRRISGWRESSLNIGRLYNPLYFRGGIALHGSQSVPLYPASHGCIRLPMHVADYLPEILPNGTPVHVMA